jgi:hypothetical protein
MFKTVSLAVVSALCISASAVAAPHSASGIILTYDLNKDESLPLEEFVDARRARFNASDTNKDGVLDESEYVYEWEGKVEKRLAEDRKASVKQTHIRFHAVDSNDDEFITIDEVNAVGERSFSRMDSDNDGVVALGDPEPAPRRSASQEKDDKPELVQPKTVITSLQSKNTCLSLKTDWMQRSRKPMKGKLNKLTFALKFLIQTRMAK